MGRIGSGGRRVYSILAGEVSGTVSSVGIGLRHAGRVFDCQNLRYHCFGLREEDIRRQVFQFVFILPFRMELRGPGVRQGGVLDKIVVTPVGGASVSVLFPPLPSPSLPGLSRPRSIRFYR